MAIYERSQQQGRLRQGELVSGVIQAKLTLDAILGGAKTTVELVEHPLAIILTQDCDLQSDSRAREKNDLAKQIPNILFCEVNEAESLQSGPAITSKQWNEVKNNKNERYQYLRQIAKDEDALGEGLPALAIDFKRFFTVPADEVYTRLSQENGTVRRACLNTPYREHLATRFNYFQQRIGLPEDHYQQAGAISTHGRQDAGEAEPAPPGT